MNKNIVGFELSFTRITDITKLLCEVCEKNEAHCLSIYFRCSHEGEMMMSQWLADWDLEQMELAKLSVINLCQLHHVPLSGNAVTEIDRHSASAYVIRYLDISTAHFTLKTANAFALGEEDGTPEDQAYGMYCYDLDGYGTLIALDTGNGIELPNDLERAVKFAEAAGCQYMRMDGDGQHYDHLTEYDWS